MKLNTEILTEMVLRELNTKRILNETQILTEASLARVLTKYFDIGFIALSADRSCEAEKGGDCTPEDKQAQEQRNTQNENEIRKDIRNAGFGFIPTYGGFRELIVDPDTGKEAYMDNPNPEMSFIVPAKKAASTEDRKDYEELKNLGVQLAKKYNQDSFLYKPPTNIDKKAYFITKTGDIDMEFENVKPNDLTQIYFTQLRKGKKDRFSLTEGKDIRFVVYVPKPPVDVSAARRRYGEIFLRQK